jgi:hypothetical protein
MQKRSTLHEDVGKLIPHLAEWNTGSGISAQAWIGCIGRFDHAVGYATLFWPDFVVHEDCIFLDAPEPEHFDRWMRDCGGDKTEVETVVNHRHIVDIFTNSEFAPTAEMVVHVRQLLKEMWSSKLQRDFPDRRFRIEFYGDGSNNLLDYQITVSQER